MALNATAVVMGWAIAIPVAPAWCEEGAEHTRNTSVLEARREGSTDTAARKHFEALLRRWRPSASKASPPACFEKLESLRGWWVGGHDPGSCLYLEETSPGGYSALFGLESHQATWKIQRAATLQSGVLHLDGPATDDNENAFDTLYTVRAGGKNWLVPASTAHELTAFVGRKGCSALSPEWLVGMVLQPGSPDDEAYCREVLHVPGK